MAKRARWVIVPIAAGAAVLAGTDPVLAKVALNTIDPTAKLSAGGRIAEGAALIACTEDQRIKVTVTFTQGQVTGEGRTRGECAGELEPARYPVKVIARGPADFQPGQAEACAVAVNTTERGRVVDTRQWCREGASSWSRSRHPVAKRVKWVIAPIAAGAAVLAGTEPVLAKIAINTIDPTASLSARGRIAEGAALIACTEGERIEVTVAFTQGEVTGEGRTRGECAGELARYPVNVKAQGPAGFQPGQAEACAAAVNTERGKVVDTREWCREGGVELVEE